MPAENQFYLGPGIIYFASRKLILPSISPLSFECRIQTLDAGSQPLQHISMLDPASHQKCWASGTLSEIFPSYQGDISPCLTPPAAQLCFVQLWVAASAHAFQAGI